jgi:hypothetical protein
VVLLSDFYTTSLHKPIVVPIRATYLANLILIDFVNQIILGVEGKPEAEVPYNGQ